MKLSLRPRTVLLIFLIFADILILPWLLQFPDFINAYGFGPAPNKFLAQLKGNPLAGILKVVSDIKFAKLWLWSQLLVLGGAMSLFWKFTNKRKNKITDGVGGPETAGNGQHGTSRWRIQKEVEQTTTVWNPNKPIKKGGIILGAELNKQKVFLETDDTHTLIIGATRSGKSRRLILPTIWELAKTDESMILTDPKGELYEKTSTYLKEQGYEVVLLDFRNPKKGNRWNPVEPVIRAVEQGDDITASEAAWDIAHMFVHQNPHTGDPIWANGQESTIASLILAVSYEADTREQKHMASINAMLNRLGRATDVGIPLNIYLLDSLPDEHLAKTAFGPAAVAPGKTRASFFAGASADLRLWSDPSVAAMTASQDHELDGPGKRKTATFLVIPDERSTRHILASLYVAQTYQALIDLANQNQGRLPNRVNFLLDEFGNLPPIPDFEKKMTVAAGRGIRFTLAVQDVAQIKKYYKENTQTITGNCHTWIYLATADVETAKLLSAKTGRYTVQSESQSSSVSEQSQNFSQTQSITGRDLLTPDEVLRWPLGQALVLQTRQFPARLKLPDLSEWPAEKDFIADSENIEKPLLKTIIWVPKINFGTKEVGDNRQLEREIDITQEPDILDVI